MNDNVMASPIRFPLATITAQLWQQITDKQRARTNVMFANQFNSLQTRLRVDIFWLAYVFLIILIVITQKGN